MIRTGMPEFFMQESTPDSLTEKIPTFQKLRTMKQLFFHLVPVLAFGLVLAACDNDSDEWTQPYEFAWSYGAESQFSVGKPATFTDLSLGVETREWSFDIEVFYPLSARIKALELTPKGCIRLDTPVSFGLTEVEGNPTSYQWTFEGGTPSSSTDPAPVVTWTSANKNGAREGLGSLAVRTFVHWKMDALEHDHFRG